MTPQEAADHFERWSSGGRWYGPETQQALRVLIDHARATAESGDLAALATDLDDVEDLAAGPGFATVRGIARRGAATLRAHRCGAAGAPAEPEIVTGEQAAELPVGSIVAPCRADGTPLEHGPSVVGTDAVTSVFRHRVFYRAPEPPAPVIEVGQTITTEVELDACPVNSVIRDDDGDVAVRIDDGDWWINGDPTIPSLPARVLDLGDAS